MHFSIPYYYCSMTTSDYVLVGDHNLYSASEANSQWMQIAEVSLMSSLPHRILEKLNRFVLIFLDLYFHDQTAKQL